MRFVTGAVVGLALLSGQAMAQGLTAERDTERRSYQLCDSWRYDSTSGGYNCGFMSYVEILDSWDLNNLDSSMRAMQQTIRDLEMRVQRLESECARP